MELLVSTCIDNKKTAREWYSSRRMENHKAPSALTKMRKEKGKRKKESRIVPWKSWGYNKTS